MNKDFGRHSHISINTPGRKNVSWTWYTTHNVCKDQVLALNTTHISLLSKRQEYCTAPHYTGYYREIPCLSRCYATSQWTHVNLIDLNAPIKRQVQFKSLLSMVVCFTQVLLQPPLISHHRYDQTSAKIGGILLTILRENVRNIPLVFFLSFWFEQKGGSFGRLMVSDVTVSSYAKLMFTTITFCVHIYA